MRRLAVVFALAAFVAAGAAQPELPEERGPEMAQGQQDPDAPVQKNLSGNETGNATRGPANVPEPQQGRTAQFNARLMTAIKTVEVLAEIAPSDNSERRLNTALSILRSVQEDTDTESLGPGNRTEPEMNETGEENETQESERRGPPEDRGPSQNGNRPGFVNQLLGGLFG